MVMVSAGLLPMLVGIVALANKLRGSPGRSLHVTAQYVTLKLRTQLTASKAFLTAVPDLKMRLVVGDRIVSHLRFTGHFTGTFQGTAS
jgi:hypothetical protein